MATVESGAGHEESQARTVSVRKRALDWLWTTFLRVYAGTMYVLPISLARLGGRLLARLAYCALPRRRRIGMGNLDRAYGDSLSRREKVAILKGSFANFGITVAELSRIPDLLTERGRHYVRVEGTECIDRSQGGLFVGAHLGNWEWVGPSMVRLGLDVAEVVKEYRDPARGDLIDAVRRSGGMETIPKRRATRKILRAVRKGKFVGLLIDQSAREGARQVDVFGHPCWATGAPAQLALRTGVPVYTGGMRREKDGNYTLTISGPVEFEKTGDMEADVDAYTQLLQSAIELLIRENPEQWTWTHDRWKPRGGFRERAEVQSSESR